VNEAAANEWCMCTGAASLVCRFCARCFCGADPEWQRRFWMGASAGLTTRRHARRKAAPQLSLVQPSPRGPVILLVDDDRTVHAIVRRVLESFEGTLLHAYDGMEALRIARQVRPDLVITDALLPGLDGRQLARMVKIEKDERIKVAVLTAIYKGTRYRNEAFRDFMVDAYLEKPVTAPRLRALVQTLLGVTLDIPAAVAG
jgi:CheY-like chemotaxis protein